MTGLPAGSPVQLVVLALPLVFALLRHEHENSLLFLEPPCGAQPYGARRELAALVKYSATVVLTPEFGLTMHCLSRLCLALVPALVLALVPALVLAVDLADGRSPTNVCAPAMSLRGTLAPSKVCNTTSMPVPPVQRKSLVSQC